MLRVVAALTHQVQKDGLSNISNDASLIDTVTRTMKLISHRRILTFIAVFSHRYSNRNDALVSVSTCLSYAIVRIVIVIDDLQHVLSTNFLAAGGPARHSVRGRRCGIGVTICATVISNQPIIPITPIAASGTPLALYSTIRDLVSSHIDKTVSARRVFTLITRLRTRRDDLFLISTLAKAIPTLPSQAFFCRVYRSFGSSCANNAATLAAAVGSLCSSVLYNVHRQQAFLSRAGHLVATKLMCVRAISHSSADLHLAGRNVTLLFPSSTATFIAYPACTSRCTFIGTVSSFASSVRVSGNS